MTEALRERNGCREVRDSVIHRVKVADKTVGYKTCVGNYWDSLVLRFLKMYNSYKTGILPHAGSLGEQSNKLIEIFQVIESYKYDREIELRKKQRQEESRRSLGRQNHKASPRR